MIVRTFHQEQLWIDAALLEWKDLVQRVKVEGRNEASICLSGGTSPELVYRAMAAEILDGIRVDLWLGDERAVPSSDPLRNGGMVERAFSACVWNPVPRLRLWPNTLTPDDAARSAQSYQEELRDAFNGFPVFDLLILGLGSDGHTASLFPGDAGWKAASCSDNITTVTTSPIPPHTRMTLLPRALNAARRVLFIVKGADRLPMINKLQAGDQSIPASLFAGPDTVLLYLA